MTRILELNVPIAQDAQQHPGSNVGRIMHAGIQAGKADQRCGNAGQQAGFSVEKA